MAQSRKAATEHCSFCGHHKNDVPLIVTSQLNTQAACCSTCALTIVHQTQSWAYGVFNTVVTEKAKLDRNELRDKTDDAIAKASG